MQAKPATEIGGAFLIHFLVIGKEAGHGTNFQNSIGKLRYRNAVSHGKRRTTTADRRVLQFYGTGLKQKDHRVAKYPMANLKN